MRHAFLDWRSEGLTRGEHQGNNEKRKKVEERVRDEKWNGVCSGGDCQALYLGQRLKRVGTLMPLCVCGVATKRNVGRCTSARKHRAWHYFFFEIICAESLADATSVCMIESHTVPYAVE
jgi:hypothetical protein